MLYVYCYIRHKTKKFREQTNVLYKRHGFVHRQSVNCFETHPPGNNLFAFGIDLHKVTENNGFALRDKVPNAVNWKAITTRKYMKQL